MIVSKFLSTKFALPSASAFGLHQLMRQGMSVQCRIGQARATCRLRTFDTINIFKVESTHTSDEKDPKCHTKQLLSCLYLDAASELTKYVWLFQTSIILCLI